MKDDRISNLFIGSGILGVAVFIYLADGPAWAVAVDVALAVGNLGYYFGAK